MVSKTKTQPVISANLPDALHQRVPALLLFGAGSFLQPARASALPLLATGRVLAWGALV